MNRRTIGPAYERSPSEKINEWVQRNLLTLSSALVLVVVFWFLYNEAVIRIMNFMSTGGDPTAEPPYSADHPISIAIEIVGALMIIGILVKTRTK